MILDLGSSDDRSCPIELDHKLSKARAFIYILQATSFTSTFDVSCNIAHRIRRAPHDPFRSSLPVYSLVEDVPSF